MSHPSTATDPNPNRASSPTPTPPCSTKPSPVAVSPTTVDDIQDFDSCPLAEDIAKGGPVGCAGVEGRVGLGPSAGVGTSGTSPRAPSPTYAHAVIPSRAQGAFYRTPDPNPNSSPTGRHPSSDLVASHARSSSLSLLSTTKSAPQPQPFPPQTAAQNVPRPEVCPTFSLPAFMPSAWRPGGSLTTPIPFFFA